MAYTNSPLVDCTIKSPNHSGKRTHKIDRITPHCVVGQATAEAIGSVFTPKSRQGSCNYGIGKDGRVCLIVDEANRSWCSSSNANDQRAITIECASDTKHPYAMTDAVYSKLIQLCADICERNGITRLLWFKDKDMSLKYAPKDGEAIITVHRWFDNKACPGDWLFNRLGELATEVNKLLCASANTDTTPAPSVPSTAPTEAVEYKVGDLVHFTGCLHYTNSYKSGVAKACKAGVAKVIALSKGNPHPYSLKAAGGGSTVYGWVNASDIACKATSTRAKTYKVVKGDTLGKIAKAHGTTADTLVKLNAIKNKNTIFVGQIIKLP